MTGNSVPVLLDLIRHPVRYFVVGWNWKSAVLSALVRGAIFFTTNLTAGLDAAFGALLAEFAYRTLLSGVAGSITQALRRCEPAWAGTLWAVVILPVFGHGIEFLVHWLRGTPRLHVSVLASVSFTVASTLFNLYAMRHGLLLVGAQGKPLLDDLRRMPMILVRFVAAGPILLRRAVRCILCTR